MSLVRHTGSPQHTVAKRITFTITYNEISTEGQAMSDQVFAPIKYCNENTKNNVGDCLLLTHRELGERKL